MAGDSAENRALSRLERLSASLQDGALKNAQRLLKGLHPAEIAHLIESLTHAQRELVWQLVDREDSGEVLLHLGDDVRAGLIESMEPEALVAATEGLDLDDLADLLQDLPAAAMREALAGMDHQYRQRLEAMLSYDEDSAGGLMDPHVVTIRADVTLDVVLRYLRRLGEMPEFTDSLFVVNRYERYLGVLPLADLVTNNPDRLVSEVMDTQTPGLRADTRTKDVAKRFEDRDLLSAPVIDENGRLLGRITVDDVVDVIRDEAEQSVRNMAGLNVDEDLFAPILSAARRRAIWLGINLVTAFIASAVVGQFQATLEQIVALAVLMPIVASMGGIAGSQTLTLVVRGLALGQISRSNRRFLIRKEIAVGVLNGLVWAVVVGVVALFWFEDSGLGFVIGIALVINLLVGAASGVGIPLIMRKIGVDPALAGGVILTTFTDVMGFLSFLGLATIFLL